MARKRAWSSRLIAILHAYSAANIGDGRLVSLTVDRIRSVSENRPELSIVSLDDSSFHEFGRVVGTGLAGQAPGVVMARAISSSVRNSVAASLAWRRFDGQLGASLRDASAFVAVGGGYLRAKTPREQVGTFVNHVPQLMIASRSTAPSIYLPQSIGPLTGPTGRMVRRALGGIDTVVVRDDVSKAELAYLGERVVRMPDLVVLEVADKWPGPAAATSAVVLIGRQLSTAPPSYASRLQQLPLAIGGEVHWAVQAGGSVEKSDETFYRSMGMVPSGPTEMVVGSHRPAAVVSVRLHGALVSLVGGTPAIHIAYERKGLSAMQDLGLGEWTHRAADFDPRRIADQVGELRADPSRYWNRLESALPRVREQSQQLDALLARIIR